MTRAWGALCIIAFVACGDGADAPDATPIDATEIDAEVLCHTLLPEGDPIAEMLVAEAAPAIGGGTITDGLYLLTARQIYTGPTGQAGPTGMMVRAKTVNDGGQFEYLEQNGITAPFLLAGTYETSAENITIVTVCPTGQPPSTLTQFDAVDSQFTLFDFTHPLGTLALTFTKP